MNEDQSTSNNMGLQSVSDGVRSFPNGDSDGLQSQSNGFQLHSNGIQLFSNGLQSHSIDLQLHSNQSCSNGIHPQPPNLPTDGADPSSTLLFRLAGGIQQLTSGQPITVSHASPAIYASRTTSSTYTHGSRGLVYEQLPNPGITIMPDLGERIVKEWTFMNSVMIENARGGLDARMQFSQVCIVWSVTSAFESCPRTQFFCFHRTLSFCYIRSSLPILNSMYLDAFCRIGSR